MYTKVELFNLALSALLLSKEIIDPVNDPSNEARVLRVNWNAAFRSTLEDLDLDATASQKTLELIEENPNILWRYSYKYPTNCSFLRRIQSTVLKDNRTTQIKRRVTNINGIKVILTNECDAVVEYIANDLPISILSASAGLAVAYKLAWLSAPLIAGKGAVALRKEITTSYLLFKGEAQEHDRNENANFDEDDVTSEFVEARLS